MQLEALTKLVIVHRCLYESVPEQTIHSHAYDVAYKVNMKPENELRYQSQVNYGALLRKLLLQSVQKYKWSVLLHHDDVLVPILHDLGMYYKAYNDDPGPHVLVKEIYHHVKKLCENHNGQYRKLYDDVLFQYVELRERNRLKLRYP